MFHIHGDLTLRGNWPSEFRHAVGTIFAGTDFRKLFGYDFIAGGVAERDTYPVSGHGRLSLSDMFASADVIFDRIKAKHGRSYEIFCKQMHEDGLSIVLRLHARESETNESQYYDISVESDGTGLHLTDMSHDDSDMSGSIDGYILMAVSRQALSDMFDMDIDELDGTQQSRVMCAMYMGALDSTFFERALALIRGTKPQYLEKEFERYLFNYVGQPANKAMIREAMDGVLAGVKA